jgi:hypothetical protein
LGGQGADKLSGGTGDDRLVAGPTDFDLDPVALQNIFGEWTSASPYADRVSHLTGATGGLNGSAVLTATTVHDDLVKDVLSDVRGSDWFVVSALDTFDLKPGEQKLMI